MVTRNGLDIPMKLLGHVRDVMRMKHYSIRTEQTHISRIKKYVISDPKNLATFHRPDTPFEE